MERGIEIKSIEIKTDSPIYFSSNFIPLYTLKKIKQGKKILQGLRISSHGLYTLDGRMHNEFC